MSHKISDPACTRLCKKAGIKSISKNCNDDIRNIIDIKIYDTLRICHVYMKENGTKTILPNHIYNAIRVVEDGTNLSKI